MTTTLKIRCPDCAGAGSTVGCCDNFTCTRCEGSGFVDPGGPWDVYLKLKASPITGKGTWMMGILAKTTDQLVNGVLSPVIEELYLMQLFTEVNGQNKVWQCYFSQQDVYLVTAIGVADRILAEFKKQLDAARFLT